jgi:ERI1 exoribonuclease 3
MSEYKRLIVLDFEANCIRNGVIRPQEIIEFPCVVYNLETLAFGEDKQFHYYCKTDVPITEFCTELTGITQQMVNNGIKFTEVMKKHSIWMEQNGFNITNSIYVTCGDWDFKMALHGHCKYANIKVPGYFKRWCNIKKEFCKFYKQKKR